MYLHPETFQMMTYEPLVIDSDSFFIFFLSFWWLNPRTCRFGLPSSGVFLFTVLRLPNKCLTKFQHRVPPPLKTNIYICPPKKERGPNSKRKFSSNLPTNGPTFSVATCDFVHFQAQKVAELKLGCDIWSLGKWWGVFSFY